MEASASSPRRLMRLFIVSSYLTYALAAAALVWSEFELVPELGPVAAVLGSLMIVAFALEGRWSMSSWLANLMGLAIAVSAGSWIYWQLNRSDDSLLNTLPFPTSMVPVAGPVMLMLFVAKLLRPKTIDDHWGLQLIALVCVGLGCTLADDFYFVLMMMAYLVSALWCLALFYLYRERLGSAGDSVEFPRHRQVLNWTMPILTLALIGFFTMPRTEQIWQLPSKTRKLDSGQSDEQSIDLNRTGTLALDPEVAFEVYVEDRHGEPKTDLPGDQRWRGPFFRTYREGAWLRFPPPRVPTIGVAMIATATVPTSTEDTLGVNDNLPTSNREDEFILTFTVKSKIGQIPFLAAPIFYPDGQALPVLQLQPNGRTRPFAQENDGLLRLREQIVPGKTRYRQVAVPAPPNNLGHPLRDIENYDIAGRKTAPPLPNLKVWTDRLLERLVAQGNLPRDAIEDGWEGPGQVREVKAQHYEAVARALEGHLARSGEYTYSLSLERSNSKIDPVEDFLYNTKSGHCNRFTTALALMLRTQGIPCQVVLGYRGADSRGDGHYDVRQCYAHSWVEVLVPQREAGPAHGMFAGPPTWHWLVVDGTPSDAAAEANAAGSRWWSAGIDWRRTFKDLILNYNADNRDEIINNLWQRAKAGWAAFRRVLLASSAEGFRARIAVSLVSVVAMLSSFLLGRWLWKRVRGKSGVGAAMPGTEFHRRLLAILARRGWSPAKGQTPREFADSLSPVLHQREQGDEINQFVRSISDLFYRVRFGQVALDANERLETTARLDWLAAALSKPGN